MDRFWSKVDIRGAGECWPWQGAMRNNGYGSFWLGQNYVGAHVAAYILATENPTDGKHVLHSCDNRGCCNPSHLRLGTPADNVKDMVERGRHRGTNSNRLSYRVARAMRMLAADEGLSDERLADLFSTSPRQVRRIINGEYWRERVP